VRRWRRARTPEDNLDPQAAAARRSLRPLVQLGVAGLLPAFGLAFYSLTQPWAKARIVFVWGLSRSPEALVMLCAGLVVALVAAIAVAWPGRRPAVSAVVHLAFGLLLGTVAWQAYALVREAGVRALGFLPIASVQPGRGLYVFTLSAAWLVALGLAELAFAWFATRRRVPAGPRAAPAADAPTDSALPPPSGPP
jgi:hypothetical protein